MIVPGTPDMSASTDGESPRVARGLEPVMRPNGKTYVPRKPPRAYLVDDPDNDAIRFVYVLGTHDFERGRELAHRITAVEPWPTVTWARLAMRGGERAWVIDEVRGAPCLIFGEEL